MCNANGHHIQAPSSPFRTCHCMAQRKKTSPLRAAKGQLPPARKMQHSDAGERGSGDGNLKTPNLWLKSLQQSGLQWYESECFAAVRMVAHWWNNDVEAIAPFFLVSEGLALPVRGISNPVRFRSCLSRMTPRMYHGFPCKH